MKYEDAGVNIDKAQKIKREIAAQIRSTWSENVLSEVGNFGGLYKLDGYRDPVLVSSVDGVGTKMLVAKMSRSYETVGEDLVNHCVNDILVQGAKPLFFLDYIAAGSLNPITIADIVRGLSRACRENGCALIAGETAEMPDVYAPDDLDLAGCIVGIVEREEIIDGKKIETGDILFGLPSTGLHTNGYSLARKILFDVMNLSIHTRVEELGCTLQEELLKIHKSYLKEVVSLKSVAVVRGLSHITGGGILDNLPRILPDGCDALVRKGSWPVPPVFRLLQEKGRIEEQEMYRTFNMGLGLVVVCSRDERDEVLGTGMELFEIGEVVRGSGRVRMVD